MRRISIVADRHCGYEIFSRCGWTIFVDLSVGFSESFNLDRRGRGRIAECGSGSNFGLEIFQLRVLSLSLVDTGKCVADRVIQRLIESTI
jgi:hypothetical protein